MPHIFGTFDANGDSEEFTASAIDFIIGNDSSNFDGATVELKVKHDDQKDWTTNSSYTAQSAYSTVNHYGFRYKLTMTGAGASTDVDYSIKY